MSESHYEFASVVQGGLNIAVFNKRSTFRKFHAFRSVAVRRNFSHTVSVKTAAAADGLINFSLLSFNVRSVCGCEFVCVSVQRLLLLCFPYVANLFA